MSGDTVSSAGREGAARVDLTVVVPFLDPGPAVVEVLAGVVGSLRASGHSFEVIAVSDGSTDGSAALVAAHRDPEVVLVELPENEGKGAALRHGFARARGDYVGFIDADGDLPPDLVGDFVHVLDATRPDILVGSKRHPDSDVVYPLARRLYSSVYQLLVRVLFRLNVRDTQVGLKFVRRDVLAAVLPQMRETGFVVDLELLCLARASGYRHIVEAPVRIGTRFTSTVSPRAVVAMIRDTFRLRLTLRGRHLRARGSSGLR